MMIVVLVASAELGGEFSNAGDKSPAGDSLARVRGRAECFRESESANPRVRNPKSLFGSNMKRVAISCLGGDELTRIMNGYHIGGSGNDLIRLACK